MLPRTTTSTTATSSSTSTSKSDTMSASAAQPQPPAPALQVEDAELRRGSEASTLVHGTNAEKDVEKAAAASQSAPAKDANLVGWNGADDKDNPHNWSLRYRIFCTFQLALLAMTASMASSIISPAAGVIAAEFQISQQVAIFNVSLYVLGFAFGPLLWAGLSETFGRRLSLVPAMFCLGVFSVATGVSKSAAALFVTRFFSGIFGSSPVSNVGATMGDLWEPKTRGIAIAVYAVAVVGGPCIGPVIGAALTVCASWRWIGYVMGIIAFFVFAVTALFLPETYPPVLLKRRAIRLRKETGNAALYHPHEYVKLDFKSIVTKQIARPIRMLFTEPIVTVIALYASFVYALLYMTLEIFAIIFSELRHWPLITSACSFLALFVGVLCALVINLGNAYWYNIAVDRNGGKSVPEARLPPMFVGAIFFATGLFWIGWTAGPEFHWILPIIAAAFIGAGFTTVFQQCINFLVDCYTLYAASALSANTFLRSILAASLAFAVRPMFDSLGAGKAMTILGAIASAAIPLPFVFHKYGAALRKRSRHASE